MNKIIFIDLLTTGLDAQKCGIYKVAGIICEDTPSEIRELCKFDFRIQPHGTARISENSLWIGNTTRRELLSFQKQDDAFKRFIEILDRYVNRRDPKDKFYLAGYNVQAVDMPFLRNWFILNNNQCFRDYFYMQGFDLMSAAAFTLMYEREKIADFHLPSVARHFLVPANDEPQVNCLSNAETCLRIFSIMKCRYGIGEMNDFVTTSEIIKNF